MDPKHISRDPGYFSSAPLYSPFLEPVLDDMRAETRSSEVSTEGQALSRDSKDVQLPVSCSVCVGSKPLQLESLFEAWLFNPGV